MILFFIFLIDKSGKFNLILSKKFGISFIWVGFTAAWYDFTFLDIKIPFLSIMSLLSDIKFAELVLRLKISGFFKDTTVILIENTAIKEKNKKKSK